MNEELYVLTDENGNEADYELVFRDMITGREYGVLAPVDEDSDAALCIVEILTDEAEDSETLSPIDDDAVIEQVFADFLEAFPELDSDAAEME